MNLRNTLLALLLAAALGGAYFYKQLNKPHLDVTQAATDVKLTATELYNQFSTDETAANTKYLEKVVLVCGKVTNTSTTDAGAISIQLDAGSEMGGVVCELDPLTKHPKTTFTPGEEICLKGLCSGYLSDVVINRCVLTN